MITISPAAGAGGGTPVYVATQCGTVEPGLEVADNYLEGLPRPFYTSAMVVRVAFDDTPPYTVTLMVALEEYLPVSFEWTPLYIDFLPMNGGLPVTTPVPVAVRLDPNRHYRLRMSMDNYQTAYVYTPTVWLQGVLRDS